jgi:hypothetical protein
MIAVRTKPEFIASTSDSEFGDPHCLSVHVSACRGVHPVHLQLMECNSRVSDSARGILQVKDNRKTT